MPWNFKGFTMAKQRTTVTAKHRISVVEISWRLQYHQRNKWKSHFALAESESQLDPKDFGFERYSDNSSDYRLLLVSTDQTDDFSIGPPASSKLSLEKGKDDRNSNTDRFFLPWRLLGPTEARKLHHFLHINALPRSSYRWMRPDMKSDLHMLVNVRWKSSHQKWWFEDDSKMIQRCFRYVQMSRPSDSEGHCVLQFLGGSWIAKSHHVVHVVQVVVQDTVHMVHMVHILGRTGQDIHDFPVMWVNLSGHALWSTESLPTRGSRCSCCSCRLTRAHVHSVARANAQNEDEIRTARGFRCIGKKVTRNSKKNYCMDTGASK